ncbi:Inactive exonuclease DIS3L2, partial [Zea mays]
MSTYNPPKYLDHKIHNMLVFLSFHFNLLRELHVKSLKYQSSLSF